jgi:quinoprotein glucose dehydrogenase
MNFIQGGGGGGGGGGRGEGRGAGSPAEAAAAAKAAAGGARGEGSAGAEPARGRGLPPLNVFGLPLIKPPYGRVTAINMNTGEHVWMQPIGDTPDAIKNHERLKGVTVPRTGRGGRLGIMLTKTLLWAGERGPLVTVNGEQGSWFRSYDKATGDIVSEMLLPANTTGVPMTYMVNNKQYIVVSVSAAGRPAEFIALTLP